MVSDPLKAAMLKYAPQLAKDYKDFVKKQFSRMKTDLGPKLDKVYNSRTWARTFQVIRDSLDQKIEQGRLIGYSINTAKLNKNAKEYGERVALDWYNKTMAKLGPLKNIKVVNRLTGDIVVTGDINGNAVKMDQQRILNVSVRGVLFHQFPARIYVNGKFLSESNYKKQIRKMKPEPAKAPAQYKCGSCGFTGPMSSFDRTGISGLACPKCRRLNVHREVKSKIDPMSRPRSFRFNYKADYWPSPNLSAAQNKNNLGVSKTETVKGMSEKEAWQKLVKRETGKWPNKFFSRIYDPELTAIYAWNGDLLWRKGK